MPKHIVQPFEFVTLHIHLGVRWTANIWVSYSRLENNGVHTWFTWSVSQSKMHVFVRCVRGWKAFLPWSVPKSGCQCSCAPEHPSGLSVSQSRPPKLWVCITITSIICGKCLTPQLKSLKSTDSGVVWKNRCSACLLPVLWACPLRNRLWSVPPLIQLSISKILFRVLCRHGVIYSAP